jgi:hypothetical protein
MKSAEEKLPPPKILNVNYNPMDKQEAKQQFKIVDNIPGAEYANAMQVSHNRDEFQLMFFNLMGLSGRVTGKVITSPGHFKRIISALRENLEKYEKQFGEVKEAAAPDKEIGFKG